MVNLTGCYGIFYTERACWGTECRKAQLNERTVSLQTAHPAKLWVSITGAGGLGRHRLVPLIGMRTLCHEVTRGGGLSATHWMRSAVGRGEALSERREERTGRW